MIVSKLKISGFRGIRSAEIPLQQFTAFIGANNCGKTTITEALALVLGRDRLVRPLTEHDFYGSTPRPVDRIQIIATLTGFEPNRFEAHTDWFRWGRATVKWQDAETGAINAQQESAADKLACQIAFAARFDDEALETVTVRYFYDADIDPFDEDTDAVPVPTDLIKQVGFFLVPANRTWDRTISFGSELFRRVVSYAGGRPAAAVLAERTRLRNPQNPLEADANLTDLVGEINADIQAIIGGSTQLKLRLTSTDSDGILEATIPHFTNEGDVPLPARRHGSGLISLQTLILLMRFGRLRIARGDSFMMVIEEPELHVPPPLQRKLLRLMQSLTTQTILTTHSPTISAVPDPHQILLIKNSNGDLSARPLLEKPLLPDAVNLIRSLFLSDREATILAVMHSCVLIPEGKRDANWLRLFVKALELRATGEDEIGLSFAHEVGVVPTKDARAAEVFQHLRAIHSTLFCLFDGDQAGTDYTLTCCRLAHPPTNIVRWPQDWEIENVVGWIVEGDPGLLNCEELMDAGVPRTSIELVVALTGPLKANEIVHATLADAMSGSAGCRRRISHVLRLLADIGSGRDPPAEAATSVLRDNGITTVWTFNDAIRGV